MRATDGRNAKRARLAALFGGLEPADLRRAAAWLSGELLQGSLGVGWSLLQRAFESAARAAEPLPLFAAAGVASGGAPAAEGSAGPLTLADVDQAFDEAARVAGARANQRRIAVLARLLVRAGDDQRRFLAALLAGELRQGAQRALVVEALAAALDVEADRLRRAVMLGGTPWDVAAAVRADGAAALDRAGPTPGVAVEPMLAAAAPDVGAALESLGGRASAETKLDGVRVQLHRDDAGAVRVFTRALREVTALVPDVVALAARIAEPGAFVVDGEAVGLDDAGRPLPFQDVFSRFAQEKEEGGDTRLHAWFFDVLWTGGASWIDRPYAERRAALERLLPPENVVPMRVVASAEEAAAALREAIAAGHEGVVLKALDGPYEAGRRGARWIKVKEAATVDLVILGAEWGHGKREGTLSNLHLGARDDEDPARFWMVGKTFKGLTDEQRAALTRDLLALAGTPDAAPRAGALVAVPPARVVEVAFDEAQRSKRYDSGLALRFARVKRFRDDKDAAAATTLGELRAQGTARGRPSARER